MAVIATTAVERDVATKAGRAFRQRWSFSKKLHQNGKRRSVDANFNFVTRAFQKTSASSFQGVAPEAYSYANAGA